MGVLNVTPDSFSGDGVFRDHHRAIRRGLDFVQQGAAWVDVGGESTRPGAEAVSLDEELERVIPVVDGLAREGVWVSVDTQKPEVARQAVEAGAKLINDVSGLREPAMMALAKEGKVQVAIMHMRGNPATMQVSPTYQDVVAEVTSFLLGQARETGLPKESIWLDPGIGFGKTLDHNLQLLRSIPSLAAEGYRVLIGVSRKSFLSKLLAADGEKLGDSDRELATRIVEVQSWNLGAAMIRTHNVADCLLALRAATPFVSSSYPG
jgi:dihydropteroate synthase